LSEFFIKSDILEIVNRVQDICQEMSGKTVLITGARGFLGRYFIEIFKQLNSKHLTSPMHVVAVDNLITSGKYAEQYDAQQDVVLAMDLNSARLDPTKFSGSGRLSLSRKDLRGDSRGTIAVTEGAVYLGSGRYIDHYDGKNYKGPDADREPVDVFISAFSVITGFPDTGKFDQGVLNFTKLTGERSSVPLLAAQDDVLYASARFEEAIRIAPNLKEAKDSLEAL
jgi:hypothetical protein